MLLEKKLAPYRKDTLLAGMPNADFFQRGNVRLRKFLTGDGLFGMIATYDANTALGPSSMHAGASTAKSPRRSGAWTRSVWPRRRCPGLQRPQSAPATDFESRTSSRPAC